MRVFAQKSKIFNKIVYALIMKVNYAKQNKLTI